MVRKLIHSLLTPAAYPEPTESVTLTETHVSFIFLTDRFVYKVKKAVDYGFLDFTTLDRRRFYCEEEIRLNSRLCPDLYLGVVELRKSRDGGASFEGGEGKVIDYAVKMKRLPEERMLARLLEKGEVGPAEMRRIASVVGEFHLRAARGPEVDACGTPQALWANWRENFEQATPFVGETVGAADLVLLRGWVERFLAENEELLVGRVSGGFIREGDGDLHLGNICLADRICIFDCIEFNERFRYLDTAADIAFLLMDLEFSGRPDLCQPFLETYREATGDPVPPRLLRFYQSHRAFVRGKVTTLRMRGQGLAPAEVEAARREASRYFRLSRGYALRDRLAPSLILTCGLMGTGKSALARELGFQLGLSPLRSDQVRKSLPPPPDRSDAYDGGIYQPSYSQATYRALLGQAERELERGKSALVDATFRRAGDRLPFLELASRLQVPCFLLQTCCPETLIRERLENRRSDPQEISDGRWEIYPLQRAEFEPPEPGESILVDTALPVPDAVDQALRGMGLLP